MFGILTQLLNLKRRTKKLLFAKRYVITKHPESRYPVVFHIKDATWEKVYVAATYQLFESSHTAYFHDKQDILLVNNARITNSSDLVIKDKEVLWDKALQANFTKVVPLDINLYGHTKDDVVVVLNRKSRFVSGKCISLLGVHANIWAHFIVQFLPKLFIAEDKYLLDNDITLIIPAYSDGNIRQIIQDYLAKYKNITLLEALPKVDYVCEELFYIPTAAYLANHAKFELTCDCVIPSYVLDLLKKKLVNNFIERVEKQPSEYEKIYLVRRGTFRCMHNWKEVEDFFVSEGFILVEPHKLTLEEKAHLFYHAKYIVGPFSSAWTNTMFANGAKGLMFCNMSRMVESYQVSLGSIGNVEVLQLTGWDDSSDIHSGFEIPLARIEKAYKEFMYG